MRKKLILSLLGVCLALAMSAQTALKKVYDEDINPIEQIDQALVKARSEGKFVICQVGGNWCPWCLRFADFITNDTTILFIDFFVLLPALSSKGRSSLLK